MNVENILKVADAIEQHSIPDLGFNMSDYVSRGHEDKTGHGCGTVACIAGWAHVLKTGSTSPTQEEPFFEESAQTYLDLEYEEADRLFAPSNWAWEDITPAQAVRTLRHLAATGEVNWDLP